MDNILQFPPKTHCGKPVPKAEFYRHLDVNTKMKQRFVEDVSSITWLYTLSPSTFNVQDGTEVHEVVVFLVDLKVKDCPNDVLYMRTQTQVPRIRSRYRLRPPEASRDVCNDERVP